MPTFDFQCSDCDYIWEFSRPFGSKETPNCPECESNKTQKLIAPPVIHFKGSGFYKTDTKKTSTKVAKEKEPTTEKKGDSKPSKTAETKPVDSKASTKDSSKE